MLLNLVFFSHGIFKSDRLPPGIPEQVTARYAKVIAGCVDKGSMLKEPLLATGGFPSVEPS